MTGKAAFTDEEWELILEAAPAAGLMVIMASRGGTFRETFSMAKAYSEARGQHGQSELVDEIVSTKPKVDHSRRSSYPELEQHALQQLGDAVAALEAKATPDEVEGYRRFVLALTERVAEAHREGDEQVSDAERATIEKIASALGATA